jgi:allophanate hydrolase subunit 1
MKRIILAMLLLFTTVATVQAQTAAVITSDKTGWQKIAETSVSFDKEKDEIMVLGADRFAFIRFKVTEAPIELIKLEVYYESGDQQDINVNKMIAKDKESQVIDLNGGERRLKKVVFYYKTVPNSADKRAHMGLWGMKTNTAK